MKKLITVILLIAIIVGPLPLYAETIEQMEESISQTQSEYDQKQNELESKKSDAQDLSNEITQTTQDIEATQNEIISTENTIDETQNEINNLEQNEIPLMKTRAIASLKFTQKNNNSNFLLATIMDSSTDISQTSNKILDQAHTAEKITSEVSKSVDDLSKTLNYVQQKKTEMEAKKNELTIKQSELIEQKQYLSDVKSKLSQEMAEIEGDMSASQDAIEAEKQKQKLYEEAGCGPTDVYGIDCANEKIENTIPAANSSGFARPTAHGYISNEYGASEFYGTGMHSGIDIANSEGTPIFPSADGIVLYSGWTSDGGGNSVVLLHLIDGANYVTRYAHMSSLNVETGASVTTSQSIGAIGNTGNSFGAHLHFEIEQGSSYVWNALENPRNYVNFPELGVWW